MTAELKSVAYFADDQGNHFAEAVFVSNLKGDKQREVFTLAVTADEATTLQQKLGQTLPISFG